MSFQDEFLGEFWQSWGRIPISVSVSYRGGGGGTEAAGDGKSQSAMNTEGQIERVRIA